jgi:hypothetical protein
MWTNLLCISHSHILVHLSCHSITKTKQGPFKCSGACLFQMNSDGGLDTLEARQRRPPRPTPPMLALPKGLPWLVSALLLPTPPAILL